MVTDLGVRHLWNITTPECDMATSTISRTIHSGTPSFSKWTVTVTNALWFSEVQASVTKFRAPSCSCNLVLHICKDPFYITRNCHWQRYVIFWSSGFHQDLESLITDNVEGLLALCDPPNTLGPGFCLCMLPVQKCDFPFTLLLECHRY
jgi:hypothetical protein